MQISTYATAEQAARATARLIVSRLSARPGLVLGLPTGATPVPMYRALVRAHQAGRADFARATTFNLDEFVGIGRETPGSYHSFMQAHLFSLVNLSPRRTHIPNGLAADAEREARRYEGRIRRAGGLDLVVLGIGRNGHLGFNEPAAALNADTHVVQLHRDSRQGNAAAFGGRWQDVPATAISMGIGTILRAREIVLLATGAAKSDIVARALDGDVTTRVPASLLQAHPKVHVVLDRAAAGRR